jgi:hypothetical protein
MKNETCQREEIYSNTYERMMKRSIKTEHVPKHFFFRVVEFEEQKNAFLALLRRRERLQILHE